jgi:hypothetical protein
MEAVWFFETLVSVYKSTRNFNPEEQYRHLHCRENRKSHIIIMMKSRWLREAERVARTGEMTNEYKFLVGNLKGRHQSEELGVDVRIILTLNCSLI